MESEIQFGPVEELRPRDGVRPDRDRHYHVVMVGEVGNDLPIFVDLDTMRDMEAHARSDTSVELGGVLLGYQQEDAEGRPFVVVTDCLRAQDYQATRGSFKFTHDTWSQITRDRAQFAPDLEMVGWYHTHPGWGVFLSGMDSFICEHFFNRPLDVALVIDPCNDERGWFQWISGQTRKTRQTGGFYLMAHHTRRAELEFFQRIFDGRKPVYFDPRDQGQPWSESMAGIRYSGTDLNGLNWEHETMDSRRWVFDIAVLTSLGVQLCLVGLIAWRLLAPTGQDAAIRDSNAAIVRDDAALSRANEFDRMLIDRDVRESVLYELLLDISARQGIDPAMAEMLADARLKQAQLEENLAGQLARVELLTQELDRAKVTVREFADSNGELQRQLAEWDAKNGELRHQLANLQQKLGLATASSQDSTVSGEWYSAKRLERYAPWASGLFLLAIGLGIGYFWGVRSLPTEYEGHVGDPDDHGPGVDGVRFGFERSDSETEVSASGDGSK